MIEENWDPVQQEHFITCCTVLQIQLSPAKGLNGPPRVALEILKDYKSTCPEPSASPLPGLGEKHHVLFRRLQQIHPRRGRQDIASMAQEKEGESQPSYMTQGREFHHQRSWDESSACQTPSQGRGMPQDAAKTWGIYPCKA